MAYVRILLTRQGNRSTAHSERRLVSGQRYGAEGLLCCHSESGKGRLRFRATCGREASALLSIRVAIGDAERNIDAHGTLYRQGLFERKMGPPAASESQKSSVRQRVSQQPP